MCGTLLMFVCGPMESCGKPVKYCRSVFFFLSQISVRLFVNSVGPGPRERQGMRDRGAADHHNAHYSVCEAVFDPYFEIQMSGLLVCVFFSWKPRMVQGFSLVSCGNHKTFSNVSKSRWATNSKCNFILRKH